MKPITIIMMLALAGGMNTAKAQKAVDTSFTMLWYKGKRIAGNKLLTPGGDTVMYDANRGTVKVVAKSGRGRELDQMLAECRRTKERAGELVAAMTGKVDKIVLPAISVLVNQAFATVESEYRDILSNALVLPSASTVRQSSAAKGGPSFEGGDEVDPLEARLTELLDYVKDHQNEKITSVPAPPRKEYSYCVYGKAASEKNYQRAMDLFRDELQGPERQIFSKAMGLSHDAYFMKSEKDYDTFNERLNPVIRFVLDRMHDKVVLLADKYGDDPNRCFAVLTVLLATDRQEQLLGLASKQIPQELIQHCFMTSKEIFRRAIDENDYSVGLNFMLLFQAERQFELITGHSIADGLFDKMLKFDQFKMTYHVSAKIHGNNGYQLAEAKAENWFMAICDTAGVLQWFLVGPNVNKMKIDLVASEVPAMKYAGTKSWMSNVPAMKIGFCGDGADSVTAYEFFPEGYEEMWTIPNYGTKNLAITNNVLMNCFLDINHIKKEAAVYQNPAEVEKLKKELMDRYAQLSKDNMMTTAKNDGTYNVRDLNKWASIQQQSRDFSARLGAVSPNKYLFTPAVHNRDKVLIDEKLDGRNLFPDNVATVYAIFNLRLEHDPEGPYSFNMNGYYFSSVFAPR